MRIDFQVAGTGLQEIGHQYCWHVRRGVSQIKAQENLPFTGHQWGGLRKRLNENDGLDNCT